MITWFVNDEVVNVFLTAKVHKSHAWYGWVISDGDIMMVSYVTYNLWSVV